MQELIIQLITGAVGGNVAGALLKKYNLGALWNTVVGVLGGAGGGQLLDQLGIGGNGIGADVAGSGVGGAVLMVVVGLIKSAMAKK